jgi:hypothetical protein
MSGFDSRHYQIFWEVVGLEQGPLGLMSRTDELHGRKSSGSSLENWDYRRRDLLRSLCDTLLSTKVHTNFADKQQFLGLYSLLAGSGRRVCFCHCCLRRHCFVPVRTTAASNNYSYWFCRKFSVISFFLSFSLSLLLLLLWMNMIFGRDAVSLTVLNFEI